MAATEQEMMERAARIQTIEELRDIAYSIVGEPEPLEFGERVVGIVESRDGTILDVIRQIKD